MTNEAMMRCENLACLCEVPLGKGTCSEYCASGDGKDPQVIVCECGHAHCSQESEKQLHGGGGSES
jgi:acetone carboxylase gamma subunit